MYYPSREEFKNTFECESPILLGQGAFGKVFKMRSKNKDLPQEFYAVKFLEVVNEKMFEKIQNEFKINKLIDLHPNVINVVQVYAWQETMPLKYCLVLIMELADHSLQKEIETRRQSKIYFSAFQLMEFFKKCIFTFSLLAKEKSIYHRDIKPENILIQEKNTFEPKITDFGVSKTLLGQNIQESLKNTLVGTPVYLSPILWNTFIKLKEQPQKLNKIKHDLEKSDIFSLGITFLQCTLMLTNEIIGLNQEEGQNKKNAILDKIDNPKIQKLIRMMLEYDEQDRPNYGQIIEEFFSGDQKGIFDTKEVNIKPKQQIQLTNAICCFNHINQKASYFCFKIGQAQYLCQSCSNKLIQFCIALPEKSVKVVQNKWDALREYVKQTIRFQFLKAVKEQIEYAQQNKQIFPELESNIQIIMNTCIDQTMENKAIQSQLEIIVEPVLKYIQEHQQDQALKLLDLKKQSIYELLNELILDKDLKRYQSVPRQKKKIFDSTTQELIQGNNLQKKSE